MEEVPPGPVEELNTTGPETVPRLAGTVILLRSGASALEVLLAQRNPSARFMGGAWVFPGGAVSPGDGEGEAGLRAAAVRELGEEAGVELAAPAQLVAYSRWITPAAVKIRYDTWFFLARAPEGAEPRVDGSEMVDARWFTPSGALAAARAGEILLVFPTIKHLEQLQGFASAAELLEHARTQTVAPVQPRVLGTGETARIVLPGEAGYDG
ncbi:MAG TPA: NUDIX hydrolase [Solirubrobacteraceae bacterium]|jgi:8-oxo-dGTP pyrophosphatase MutT (NUDIX family)|nr:NUDIX hydrolase [Solirubrobacteraceae bacterium]